MYRSSLPCLAGALALALSACGDEVTADSPLPELRIVTETLAPAAAGTFYQVEVLAVGGTQTDFTWSVVDGGLPAGISSVTNRTPSTLLQGRPLAGGRSTFTLRVQDSAGNAATRELSIEVTPLPDAVQILPATLPVASLGESYTATIAAQNGTSYEWRVQSGELPQGLRLSSTGTPFATISGTPVETGSFGFTVRVRDDSGNRSSERFEIEVLDRRGPLTIASQTLSPATVTFPYSASISASGGSGSGYRWRVESGNLPAGLDLEDEGTPSVLLFGTPTAEGFFSFVLEVEDSEGTTARATLSLEVLERPAPVRIQTFELPRGRVGSRYEQVIRTTNGAESGAFVWSLSEGSLPPGLSLEATGDRGERAVVLGEPTEVGVYDFAVEVRDALGSVDDQIYTVVIDPEITLPVILAPGAVNGVLELPNAEGGQPYTAVIQARDGAPLPASAPESEVRYNWVVSGGSLPPGLRLNPAGREGDYAATFSGRPTARGTFTATVTVYDRLNHTDDQVIRITVDPPSIPVTITTSRVDLASSGCYTDRIFAQGGGNAGYTWEIVSGALPLGYGFDRTGTPSIRISGIPEAVPGDYPVTFRVTDSFGLTAAREVLLRVDPAKAGEPRWGVMVGDIDVPNQLDIYVVDLCDRANSTPVRVNRFINNLSNVNYFTRDIQLSPRGNALAFISDGDTNDVEEVYVVDLRRPPLAGSAVRVLSAVDTSRDAVELKWSPDGGKVAILFDSSVSGADELWVADVSDLSSPGQAIRVSQPGTNSALAVYSGRYEFSPDGRKIAWVGDNETSSRDELWVVDLSGATPTAPQRAHRVFSNINVDVNGSFQWTPDSRGIVFNADVDVFLQDELFFTDVSGPGPYVEVRISGPTQSNGDVLANTTIAPNFNDHWSFSPDGTQLFYIGDLVNEGSQDLWVVDYDSMSGTFSPRRALTRLSGVTGADSAKWSPDSSRLAVRGALRITNQDELYVFDASATIPATTFTPILPAADINREMGFSFADDYLWSPDGNKLGFSGDFDVLSSEELYLADVSGAGPSYLAFKLNEPYSSSSQFVSEFRFSPDSRWVAYLGWERTSFDELRVVDISGPAPSAPVLAHPALANTSLDVFANSDTWENSWYWTYQNRIIFRGDLETSGCDWAYIVDIDSAPPYTPSLLTTAGQLPTCNEDVFFLVR